MRSRLLVLLSLPILLLPFGGAATAARGAPAQEKPSIEAKTEGMEKLDGFVPVYWEEKAGKVWLELSHFDEDVIYVVSLSAGVGSNDIGLDRNQLGGTYLVRFHRIGPKVLMVQPNTRYRAMSDNPAEVQAVQDAFARSVLWGFEVAAESDGRVLVDATDFLLRDAHGVAERLAQTRQGSYRLDKARSAVWMPRTRAFPRNTELEAVLTFAGERPGAWVRSVTPSPASVTVREHHSFVQAPPPGYEPRLADPRAGFFGVSYYDYATPVGEPLEKRLISRHRLRKKDPTAAVSEPVEPIVYYLDPGTPEPIRSALLEGASWWNQAFEAAGYQDAFRVEMLPEGADPLDVRYNVINWVHRSTRGWSYGGSVTDPRTGEIIKGHVLLGSLRVRQDYLIAEGLLSPYEDGDTVPPEMQEMALARLRQLAAHEVGHTLGLAHNYIASTQGRASVMDYPHPLVKLREDGTIDLSDAYAVGIGEWDKVAITYGYQDFPPGTDERTALEKVLLDAKARGIWFLTDQDARPAGSAHPQTHLWDNGTDAAAELKRMMKVRRAALERFGERAIRNGMPLATIEEALVPLYLHHRYQIEAAAKVVGGLYYTYAMRGDGQEPLRLVPRAEQDEAIDALLSTLDPAELVIPQSVLAQLPPRPFRYGPHRELFPRTTGLVFDPVAPATVAADLTLGMLLQPERAARLVLQPAFDPELPGLREVIGRLLDAVFGAAPADAYQQEIARAVQRRAVEQLMRLAAEAPMAQVRAEATAALRGLRDNLGTTAAEAEPARAAHAALLVDDIERFLHRPAPADEPVPPLQAPPGSPIGGGGPVGAWQPWPYGPDGQAAVPTLACDWR